MYFSSVESRWLVYLIRSVSGGVNVRVSQNAGVNVRVSENAAVSVRVNVKVSVSGSVSETVSGSVMVRPMLRETALPKRARENGSRKSQMGKSMLEFGHVRAGWKELMSSSL